MYMYFVIYVDLDDVLICFHIHTTLLNSSILSGHTITFSGISHLNKYCVSILMYMNPNQGRPAQIVKNIICDNTR